MEALPNLTPAVAPIPNPALAAKPQNIENVEITAAQLMYIDYTALGGLITNEAGELGTIGEDGEFHTGRKANMKDFAQYLGTTRQTLWNWQKSIPGFWDRVAARRKEMGGHYRLQKVWNGVYMKAAAGNPQAAALYLANFGGPDFHMPMQKVEHNLGGGMADLLNQARERERIQNNQPIDGEVIDAPAPNNA